MNPVRLAAPAKRLVYTATKSRPTVPIYSTRCIARKPETNIRAYMNESKARDGVKESEAAPKNGQLYSTLAAATAKQDGQAYDVGQQQIEILKTVQSVRDARTRAAALGHQVGLVPTMGGLHEGHLDLVREAAKECEEVYVSIYLNPTQFAKTEDGWTGTYPMDFGKDIALLEGVDEELRDNPAYRGRVVVAFAPGHTEMYPTGFEHCSMLTINEALVDVLEGHVRPLAMTGAATVVMKFLNIVMPDKVYFGQKDFQQLVIMRRMVEEFHIPVNLRAVATRRDEDGVALSSRNMYFGERRRAVADALSKVLIGAQKRFDETGKVSRKEILDAANAQAKEMEKAQEALSPAKRALFTFQYISLADPITLQETDTVGENGAVLSGATILPPLEDVHPDEKLGFYDDKNQVRLIDNVPLGNAGKFLGLTTVTDA